MPREDAQYRLHAPTLIRGAGYFRCSEGHEDVYLPGFVPRNSWEPLNEAARDAFRLRDEEAIGEAEAKIAEIQAEIDAAIEAGAKEPELEGFRTLMSKARMHRAELPKQLKEVPRFGGGKPTHSLTFSSLAHDQPGGKSGIDHEIEAAKAEGGAKKAAALRVERMVASALAGGASPGDIEELKRALMAQHAGDVAKALESGKKSGAAAAAAAKVVADGIAKKKADDAAKPEKPEEKKSAGRASDS